MTRVNLPLTDRQKPANELHAHKTFASQMQLKQPGTVVLNSHFSNRRKNALFLVHVLWHSEYLQQRVERK